MKHLVLIYFLLSVPLYAAGQDRFVDSLEHLLHTQPFSSTEQLSIYMQICNFYNNNNNNKLLLYLEKAIPIAEKEEDKSWASRFNMILGKIYAMEGKTDSAMVFYEKSATLAEKANNKDLQGSSFMMAGFMFATLQSFDRALSYFFQALSCLEFTNRIKYGRVLGQIGQVYKEINNLDKAFEYLEQAKVIAEEINDSYTKITAYYYLGSLYRIKGVEDAALEYAFKSLTISIENNNKEYEVLNACLASSIYLQSNDNTNALVYAQQAVKASEEFGEKSLMISAMEVLSRVFLVQKQYRRCEELAQKAWEMDTLNYGATGYNLVATLLYTNIQLGNAENAMYYLDKLERILEHNNDENTRKNITELEVKYETEKKETRIAALEKTRRLYRWLIVACVLLAVAVTVGLLQAFRNERKKRLLVSAEAIQEGEVGERARIAEDLHDRLGGRLSSVKMGLGHTKSLHDIGEKLDACMSELREITNNIMPRSLVLYGLKGALEDFCAQYPIVKFHFFGDDKRIPIKQEYAIYCCARELVNNALKYAGATLINLQLVQSEKHVSLTVEDNGCGFDETTVAKGYGLQNIRNRVASCNGRVDIVSSPKKGTEALIEIKL